MYIDGKTIGVVIAIIFVIGFLLSTWSESSSGSKKHDLLKKAILLLPKNEQEKAKKQLQELLKK